MSPAIATDPTTEKIGFAPIPLRILLDPTLSAWSKLTYGIIQHHDRGNGCFAARETMAAELTVSTYHIRIGVHQLLERGEITIEERGMGRTDIIRLTDRTFGIPVAPVVEPTEFELPPEPELPEEPRLPGQPAEVELESVVEPVEVEPENTELKPVETSVEIPETPCSKTRNYKYINTKNISTNTPCTKPESTEPLDRTTAEKKCEEEELISYFFEKKEDRQPTQNEIHNWRKAARRLLDEFTIDELKPAVINAVTKGAKLFYFVGLTAPDFIIRKRKEMALESDRQKHASKVFEAQREKEHQFATIKEDSREFDAQTQDLLAGLENNMRPQVFRTWFLDTFITNITQDSLTLAVASPEAADWMSKSYTALIQEITGKKHIEFIALN